MASDILTTPEIDYIIQNFKVSKLDEVGTVDWFKDKDKLCKLYQISVLEAESPPCEERVKSALVASGNIEVFVKELVTLAVWRIKILPEMCKFTPKPEQVIPTYIILYSEQLIAGILEGVLFYEELFWDLNDASIDLIEYCISQLIVLDTKAAYQVSENAFHDSDTLKVINNNVILMNCTVSISSLSILRYIVENLEKLHLTAASTLYTTHDLPVIIAYLLDKDVWSVKDGEKVYKFVDNKWKEWLPSDPMLSKVECQTWLLLRELLMNSTVDTVYTYTNHRKEVLSKLVRLLHDNVVDQLSPLAELKLWLHRLSITQTKEVVKNPFILEINSGYKEELLLEYQDKWKEIAEKRVHLLFYPHHNNLLSIVKGFANGMDGLVDLADNLNTCAVCFAKALKRCSKCHKVWYCSRKCQVDNWASHKLLCCK
ncbi:zinc finger MYND domain-containing protein 10 [Halyomorpha halys]|uniref:zinc finger MYND domain-containing protein 10 n=1 Tax=Halyomorpha halys TaxID=286706 RepID=UPI0006D4FED9|nr:zinc finger MYND domain-containing protein 10 [Halyomorpha halys]